MLLVALSVLLATALLPPVELFSAMMVPLIFMCLPNFHTTGEYIDCSCQRRQILFSYKYSKESQHRC